MPSVSPTRWLALPFAALATALILAAVFLSYQPRPGLGWLHQLTIWVVVGLSAIGAIVGYRRVLASTDDAALRRLLMLGAIPLWAIAMLAEPFDSLDLGGYLNNGRLPVVYGLNPYVTPVDRVPNWQSDPLLLGTWHDTVCAYGFLFARLAAAVVAMAGEDRALTYLLFKLVNVAALAMTVWLVNIGCRQAGVSRSVGIFLVAWNPLILLHGLSNGHNDLLVGLGLLTALVAASSRLWWAVMPALAATALIKYSTVPLFPLAVLFLYRRHGILRTVAGTSLAAGLVFVVSRPYLADGGALEVTRNFSNVTQFLNSIGSVIVIPLQAIGKNNPAVAVIANTVASGLKLAGGLLLIGLVGSLCWRRWRSPDYTAAQFIRDAVLVQFAMIVFASSKFFGWYLLMFWPAIALLPEASRLRRTALAVGLGQLGSFTFLARAHIVSPLVLIVLPLQLARRFEHRDRVEQRTLPFPAALESKAA